jgi:hypothetical protein
VRNSTWSDEIGALNNLIHVECSDAVPLGLDWSRQAGRHTTCVSSGGGTRARHFAGAGERQGCHNRDTGQLGNTLRLGTGFNWLRIGSSDWLL